MVPGAPVDQKSYRDKIGGQLGVLSCIHHLENIMVSSLLVKNCCNNISALNQSKIQP